MHLPARNRRLLMAIFVLLALVLACNMPGLDPSDDEPDQIADPDLLPVDASDSEGSAAPSDDQPPSDEPLLSADTPSGELGLSRANPYPIDTEVVTTLWDFKVLEFYRGEAAWQIILADDSDNAPPPAGKEYALVKIFVRSKNPETYAQSFSLDQIFITGDAIKAHTDKLIDHPIPELVFADFNDGDVFTAWLDVLVEPAEGNLMLVYDNNDYEIEKREVRYIALELGASIEIPAELDAIAPTELGLEPENPAQIGQTVIGDDWEFTVLEAVGGQPAVDIVMQMSEGNDPPVDGLEYIVYRARIRRISTADRQENRPSLWPLVGEAASENWNSIQKPRIRIKNRELFPVIEYYFFPGFESEGWFVLIAPAGQAPQIAGVTVGDMFPTRERYFQLTP